MLNNKYDNWHLKVAASESVNELNLCNWHHEAFKICNDLNGKKVLEVGCGRGDFSLFLASYSEQVQGIDFSVSAIEIAEQRSCLSNSSNVEFRVADAQDLPFLNNEFDVVYSCECIEHLPNPQQAINEIYRV